MYIHINMQFAVCRHSFQFADTENESASGQQRSIMLNDDGDADV